MEVYASKFEYKMVIFYLSYHFEDYLCYPPSIGYHLQRTRFFDDFKNIIFQNTVYKFPTNDVRSNLRVA